MKYFVMFNSLFGSSVREQVVLLLLLQSGTLIMYTYTLSDVIMTYYWQKCGSNSAFTSSIKVEFDHTLNVCLEWIYFCSLILLIRSRLSVCPILFLVCSLHFPYSVFLCYSFSCLHQGVWSTDLDVIFTILHLDCHLD